MKLYLSLLFFIFTQTLYCDNFPLYKKTFQKFIQSNDLYQISPQVDTDDQYLFDVNLKSQLKEHLASIRLKKSKKNQTSISIYNTISKDYNRKIPFVADSTVEFQEQIFQEIFKRQLIEPKLTVKNIFLEDLLHKIKDEMKYDNFEMKKSEDQKFFKVNFMNEESTTLQVQIKIVGDLNDNFLYDLKFSTDFYFSTQNKPENQQWIVDIFGHDSLTKQGGFLSNIGFGGKNESDFFDQFNLKGNYIDCNKKIIEAIARSVPYLYKVYNYSPALITYRDIAHLISKYASLRSVNGNYIVASTFEPKEDQIGDHTLRFFKIDDINQKFELSSDQAIGTYKFYRMDQDSFNSFLVDQIKLEELLETMFSQVVRIFKEEYNKVFSEEIYSEHQVQVNNYSKYYYTQFDIVVKDKEQNEFLKFDFQEYNSEISMSNDKILASTKFNIKFKTLHYSEKRLRNYISMALRAHKLIK